MATAVACGTGLAPSTTTDAATGKAAAGGTGVAPSAGTTASVRMDPNSSYLLKIRLVGNKRNARKEIKCFYFEKMIDSDLTNYKDLVESIVDEYPPRYLEVAHVQYYDDVLKIFPEVKTDQDLMFMFEKFSKTKAVQMFISYCDPAEPYEPITEYSSDFFTQTEHNIEQDDDSYLRNPIPENEHVGIDEENLYLEKEPTPLNVVLFLDNDKDTEYVPEDDSEYGSEDECEIEEDEPEIEEDEEVHEAEHAPTVEYNKKDPPMAEGSKYPNMAEFKLALSQHAVKYEFEYNIQKSAQHRFRAYCRRRDEDKCPWRIYASTTDDMCTVVDWLIEDATLGATALQQKLKEHYKVKLHYKRVYMEGHQRRR
ncbi:uncharacterized protein LOC123400148 [Hordeum vulgare subsp. vulgare]|uniref:uncharacterized protein LOC123400148 n=1 Tax=Hordeum vulgare subsp. vulgare TaxID=112509 RepID=UPI001D1A4DCE|nr:uncharacterized protein LOC123400148 [Hordeum vulgare subsp. vulgare]